MKMTWVDFSKTVLAWCALGLPISAVPLTGAFAAGDISFSKETVLLKVLPEGKIERDWFEATFCLESVAPFQVSELFDAKRVVLRMPDLDSVVLGDKPPFTLTRIVRLDIPADTPTIVDDQQKYRYTSRTTNEIWDLQLDPSPNTSCYPGIWGYIWVNKMDIYKALRGYLSARATPESYRDCIRGDIPAICGDGLDEAEMIFDLGPHKWVGQVRLEPKRGVSKPGAKTEKFIIAD
jgi:hypothetical protein